ncbi:alpha-L-fucosidase [bacterium]|nr:alpha-L-fucosidase [bacterium]
MRRFSLLCGILIFCSCFSGRSTQIDWWRNARTGMLVHWSLSSTPDDVTMRNTAQIPKKIYTRYLESFNPKDFNADAWVLAAKNAGMKYIIVTAKHRDGFCFFDSRHTEFDIMSTPFKRDVMKEMADACHRHGMKIGWYYSIMDLHHQDYLSKGLWESSSSSVKDKYKRYFDYMARQMEELLGNYGPVDIMWFDGEWEETWTSEMGLKLYGWIKKIQPDIIVNNRIGAGRKGIDSFSGPGSFAGDFYSEENAIPKGRLGNSDWETIISMNDHWEWKEFDTKWTKSEKLLHMLSKVVSKGGNLLLNVGPGPDGKFPEPAMKRLSVIGKWMEYYGESIYGSDAGPFKSLPWGYCTQKKMGQLTRLYLHVWEFPKDGRLVLPGLYNRVETGFYLADPDWSISILKKNEDLVLKLPKEAFDPICSVIVLDIWGKADVSMPPEFMNNFDSFVDKMYFKLSSTRNNVTIRYALNGTNPTALSPEYKKGIKLTANAMVTARCFRNGKPVSDPVRRNFRKVTPEPGQFFKVHKKGWKYKYYRGNWEKPPLLEKLTPIKKGIIDNESLCKMDGSEGFGLELKGYLKIPKTGMYELTLLTDSRFTLQVGEKTYLSDTSSIKEQKENNLEVALSKGWHPIKLQYYNSSKKSKLYLLWRGPGIEKEIIPSNMIVHK